MNKRLTSFWGIMLVLVIMISGSGVVYITASLEQAGVLLVEPNNVTVTNGESFTLAINIANVSDLNSWQITICWNASIIELNPPNSSALIQGSFLKSVSGVTTYFKTPTYVKGSGVLNNVEGGINQQTGAKGSGTLFTLNFNAVGDGSTQIVMSNFNLFDPSGVPMKPGPTSVPGKVTVNSGSVVHDIAVVRFECQHTVLVDQQVRLNATVENEGTANEANVEVYMLLDSNLYNQTSIPQLRVDSEANCSFSWTPYSVGTYSVTVYARPVASETNTQNNNVSCQVMVTTRAVDEVDVSFSPLPPSRILLGSPVWLNTTVKNLGIQAEANLLVSIYLDGTKSCISEISKLAEKSSEKAACYLWHASHLGTCKITASVTYVNSEQDTATGNDSVCVTVYGSAYNVSILIVSDDNAPSQVGYHLGTSLPEFKSALQAAGYKFDLWNESAQGHPSLALLKAYDVVIWTCGDFIDYTSKTPDATDAATLEKYLDQGGNILIEGQRVCWERQAIADDFANDVLHINYLASCETAPLEVLDPSHPIASNLPINISWAMQPLGGADGVDPVNGGEKIVAFGDVYEYGAIVAFDGTEADTGSTIVYSFPLYWLPLNDSKTLVLNSVDWLTRFGIDKVAGKIVKSPTDSVYFVYTDPEQMGSTATYDAAAGAMIFSLCDNPQHQGFFDTLQWFLPRGEVNQTAIDNSVIVVVGKPVDQPVTRYYESTDLPQITSTQNSTCYIFQNDAGVPIASILKADVANGTEDLCVIQAFKEGNNELLLLYGFSWRGTYAAGMFFAQEIAKNLSNYPFSYMILKWQDKSLEGVPQLSEIEILKTG